MLLNRLRLAHALRRATARQQCSASYKRPQHPKADAAAAEASAPVVAAPAAEAEGVPVWMEAAGWYGTFAVLGAYAASSHDQLDVIGGKLGYQVLNTTGAIGVALVCWRRRTYQPLVINMAWATIGASALATQLGGDGSADGDSTAQSADGASSARDGARSSPAAAAAPAASASPSAIATQAVQRVGASSPFSQLQVVGTVSQPGDARTFPAAGDELVMHYTGWLRTELAQHGERAQPFDSSRSRNEPFKFTVGVGQVIKGWDQGVPKLSLGQRATLLIPSAMGYGSRGAGRVIPPDADLVFDVELLHVRKSAAGSKIRLNRTK